MAALWSCERLLCTPTEVLNLTPSKQKRRRCTKHLIYLSVFLLASVRNKPAEVLYGPLWKLQSSFTARCNSANISYNPCQTRLWVVNKCPLVNSTIKMISKDIFYQMLANIQTWSAEAPPEKKGEVVWVAWKASAEVWWLIFYVRSRTWSFNVWNDRLGVLRLSARAVKADGMPAETSDVTGAWLTHLNLHV